MLGAVVTSFNDGYKLREWVDHYKEMSSAIDRYLIVDNGSEKEYLDQVKEAFPEAAILELGENAGTTGAYNAGILYLLNDKQIDYIMLIGNDIRIMPESINKMITYLDSHKEVGMVAPILLKKDSRIIEDGGCFINRKEYTLNPQKVGESYDSISRESFYVDATTGGMNIASRSFYEIVGLQDDALFMYSDEVDMAIRAAKQGIRMAVVSEACAWHQHINPQKKQLRHPYSAYLMGRNKVYLAYKHDTAASALRLYLKYFFNDSLRMFRALLKDDRAQFKSYAWHLNGAYHGLRHDMRKNKYSSIEG